MQQAQDRTRTTSTIPTSPTVIETFPAGGPRGSWPAAHTVVRTSNFHYAHMRCAQSTARSITVRQAFGAAFGAVSADEFAELRTVQGSYYLLAAAYQNAGRRIERRERRAENWAYFRQNPARMVRSIARDWARSVRRAVNV